MVEESRRESATASMRRINQAWLDGHVEDLVSLVHPEIVIVFPGFAGRVQRKEDFFPASAISAGTREFMSSLSKIITWTSRAIWLWSAFDMRWFTNVLAALPFNRSGSVGAEPRRIVDCRLADNARHGGERRIIVVRCRWRHAPLPVTQADCRGNNRVR